MEKKVVLITGSSSGIGFELAKIFIKKGFVVYGASRNLFQLDGLNHIPCDISSLENCKETILKIIEKEGKIDLLVNNAGIGISGSVENTSETDARKIYDVNFFGTFFMCKSALPYLRQSKGRIVNVSSVASKFFIPFQGFYSATKASIDAISSAMRAELKPFKVKVSNVHPGDTKTSFTKNRIKQDDGVYNKRYIKSISKMEKDEQNGMSSLYVAKKIYKVATKKHPPKTLTIGLSYKFLLLLGKILPHSIVEWIISKIYSWLTFKPFVSYINKRFFWLKLKLN